MVTKEELEVNFQVIVASLLERGQTKIKQYLKDKGVSDETMQKAKDAADSLIDDFFNETE